MVFDRKAYDLIWRAKNKDRIKEYSSKYRKRIGSEWKRLSPQAKQRAKERHIVLDRKYHSEVFQRLGSRCSRCGFADIRALQIDHVNGDRHLDRKTLWNGRRSGTGRTYYKYLLDTGIATGRYQLLCANCNWIKRHELKEHLAHGE